MRDSEMKDRIISAFAEETPDILDRIMQACENETQVTDEVPSTARILRPKFRPARFAAVAATFLLMFVMGGLLGRMTGATPDPVGPVEVASREVASIYIDVNPSVELRLDEDYRVTDCIASNDEAAEIMEDMNLVGVEVRTAMNAIVGSMYMNGYLSAESNSILVSVDKEDGNVKQLLSDIVTDVNRIFERADMECSIIAQQVNTDDATAALATEHGVSVGKVTLVEKIRDQITGYSGMDISELISMPIKDLNLIYSAKPDASGELTEQNRNPGTENDPESETEKPAETEPAKSEQEIISGNVGGYVGWADALADILKELAVTNDDISTPDVSVTFERDANGKRQFVYSIQFEIKSTGESRTYKVNCSTGEIETVNP